MKKVKIFEENGSGSRHIHALIENNGDLVISVQDVGSGPELFLNDGDYEFLATVKPEDKDRVTLALIEKMFGGRGNAADEFRKFLDEKGIPCEFQVWS